MAELNTSKSYRWRVDGNKLFMAPAISPPPVRVSDIQSVTAEFYDISPALMAGAPRHREAAQARQIAMYIAKKMTRLSYPCLGRKFKRDHSTVIHGVKRVMQRLECEPDLAGQIEAIKVRIHEVWK